MLPPTTHNFILFELDFVIKFHLLRLLQFLSDLKSTIPDIPGFGRRLGKKGLHLLIPVKNSGPEFHPNPTPTIIIQLKPVLANHKGSLFTSTFISLK